MTKRTRLLLAGAVVVLLAFIPGSASADTVGGGGHVGGGHVGGCHGSGGPAPAGQY